MGTHGWMHQEVAHCSGESVSTDKQVQGGRRPIRWVEEPIGFLRTALFLDQSAAQISEWLFKAISIPRSGGLSVRCYTTRIFKIKEGHENTLADEAYLNGAPI